MRSKRTTAAEHTDGAAVTHGPPRTRTRRFMTLRVLSCGFSTILDLVREGGVELTRLARRRHTP